MLRKCRLTLLLTMGLLTLAFSAVAGRTIALAQRRRVDVLQFPDRKSVTSQVTTPITLGRAWELVAAEAQNWQEGAKVVSLHSIDHPDDTDAAGREGRRRAWQAVLAGGKEKETERVITLVDGVIQEDAQQPTGSEGKLALERPQIDSPEILRCALKLRPALAPEENKGQGFHFVLGRSPTGAPVVTVRGNYRNLPAVVSFEAAKGTLMEARTMEFEAGGLLFSRDAGRTWHASDLVDKTVTAVIPDPTLSRQAYATVAQDQRIVVYCTEDGGEHWSRFGALPASAGDWPFDVEATVDKSGRVNVLVGTWTGIWRSTDGKQWAQLSALPEGPKQWLAIAHSSQRDRLFVTVTAGEKPGVYATEDFSDWTRLIQTPLRLSKSFDAQAVLATDEQGTTSAWLLGSEGENQVELEAAVLRAAGDFESGLFALQSTLQGTGYRSPQGKDWTLSVPVASLAASTGFPKDRVIVAGGFRTGIYRSPDAGQTWEMVLSNPARIVPGNNEVYDMAFLTEEAVIAINGSILTWEDF